ncbi:MAG TPA: hypothetical protein VMP01_02400 [Pirellulaceae bacterium]|nr:hypothetical protein [Pirellulaceae bacterium]
MRTALNLLTRDGAVYVAFRPHLTLHQYDELLMLIKEPSTAQEMREALQEWAEGFDLRVSFDELECV